MANYLTTDTDLISIADAIRTKGGTSASLVYPSGFISAIEDIPSGGGGYTADDIALRSISGIVSGSASMINAAAFKGNILLTGASFPNCREVNMEAFMNCFSLEFASFPSCTFVGNSAFYSCNSLSEAYFPLVMSIGSSAFVSCQSLVSVSFPKCTSLGVSVFANCGSLEKVSLVKCTTLPAGAFARCYKLSEITLSSGLSSIGNSAFNSCSALSYFNAYSVSKINNSVFANCWRLLSLYLLDSSVATLSSTGTFISTPIAGYTGQTGGQYGSIFVRASLLTSWKTANIWSVYSDRFVGLTDAQIEELW